MLHTRSMNILTCISTRFDTQGFVDISPVLDHVLKFNPYVSGLFCTCGVIVIQCVLDISRYLFLINSHKMSRGSPIRTRYGVSLWIHSMKKVFYFFFSCCVLHQVIFDRDITRCLCRYYCPQITGTTLECEIWRVQGNYSLCGGGASCRVGGASCRGVSWGLEPARLDVMLIVSLWILTGTPAALPRCQSNFRVIEDI